MSFTNMRQFMPGSGCVKISNSNKEVSVASDDSCGTLPQLSRSDIRLYRNNENVTHEVWPEYKSHEMIYASLENLEKAIAWLKGV